LAETKICEMTEEFQFVLVWSLPKGYDTETVFSFLGDNFPIVRKGRTNLSIAVPKNKAEELVKTKNSQIFNERYLVGVMFDKPPEPRREASKKPTSVDSIEIAKGKISPPSHSQQLIEKQAPAANSPRPDLSCSSGGIFSPRPGPALAGPVPSFASSFAAADASNTKGPADSDSIAI